MEHPILFSTPMVKAILDGRKTMTRRVLKIPKWAVPYEEYFETDGKTATAICEKTGCQADIQCPYGKPGDILWVRETWWKYGGEYLYRADGDEEISACSTPTGGYPSECRNYPGCEGCTRTNWKIPWKPSIHMPKAACRIKLKITNIRVERLQDISTEDICNEGIWVEPPPIVKTGAQFPSDFENRTETQKDEWFETTARATYIGQCDHIAALHREWENLWDSLNANRGYGWDKNPWVWVVEFERVME